MSGRLVCDILVCAGVARRGAGCLPGLLAPEGPGLVWVTRHLLSICSWLSLCRHWGVSSKATCLGHRDSQPGRTQS